MVWALGEDDVGGRASREGVKGDFEAESSLKDRGGEKGFWNRDKFSGRQPLCLDGMFGG